MAGSKRARVLCGCMLLQQACVTQGFTRVPMSMLPPPYRRGVSVKSFKDSADSRPAVTGNEVEKYDAAGWYFPSADGSKSLLASPPVNPAGMQCTLANELHTAAVRQTQTTFCKQQLTEHIADKAAMWLLLHVLLRLLRQGGCVHTSVRAATRVN
jgi:hypothetical protein